jgi:hypothetical protein
MMVVVGGYVMTTLAAMLSLHWVLGNKHYWYLFPLVGYT